MVFAHLLEQAPGFPLGTVLYRAIYTFHMPAFLFLFGLFARFHPRRIVFSFALPYFVFQALYILFDRLASDSAAAMQFTTPYWLMWFLMVCIFYQLLIPFFDTDSRKVQAFWVCVAFVLAMLIDFDKSVSYYLSLSRFFVFLPWFLLHGFVVRGLPVLSPDALLHPLAVPGLAFAMLLLFGNPWVGKAFRCFFRII